MKMQTHLPIAAYLAESKYIDFTHPLVARKAAQLASGTSGDVAIAKHCFEFVRDEIRHSWDFKMNPVTCRASDVLIHRTGYCYAKSHLLAALLRANHIPAGLSYQRLTVEAKGPPFCLHGLNAVYLKPYGWYRVDARGNKHGVTAEFTPPTEQLAFAILNEMERDFAQIWAEPLLPVIHALTQHTTIEQVYKNLPDSDET